MNATTHRSGRHPRTATPPDVAALAALLRAAGQRVTAQRLLILGAFRPGAHLSADDVYARVAPRLPAVNRSTVYRTLEHFRDAGLISETDLGGGVRQYEPIGERPHHHLVCHDCGALLDLDDALVAPLREAVRARHGFDAGIHHLALFGRCAACSTRATPIPSSPKIDRGRGTVQGRVDPLFLVYVRRIGRAAARAAAGTGRHRSPPRQRRNVCAGA